MENPFKPRTHIEVFENRRGGITIKTIGDQGEERSRYDELVAIDVDQIDDLIKALQAVKWEIENK